MDKAQPLLPKKSQSSCSQPSQAQELQYNEGLSRGLARALRQAGEARRGAGSWGDQSGHHKESSI